MATKYDAQGNPLPKVCGICGHEHDWYNTRYIIDVNGIYCWDGLTEKRPITCKACGNDICVGDAPVGG